MKTMLSRNSMRKCTKNQGVSCIHSFGYQDIDYAISKGITNWGLGQTDLFIEKSFGSILLFDQIFLIPSHTPGTHYHEDVEIILLPLKGTLTHKSITNDASFPKMRSSWGDVVVINVENRMIHLECNNARYPVEYIEIWLKPSSQKQLKTYDSFNFRSRIGDRHYLWELLPGSSLEAADRLNEKTWLYMGLFDADDSAIYRLHGENQGVYLFVIRGMVEVCQEEGTWSDPLEARDGVCIWDTEEIAINMIKDSVLLVLEVPLES